MRIGIDIDGVLNNCVDFQRDCGTKYCYELGKHEFKGVVEYKLYDTFGWDEETDTSFWDRYYRILIKEMPIRRFAKEVIDKLKQEGHEIYIITARASSIYDSPVYSLEEIKADTISWLTEKEVYYDKLLFVEDPKLEDCMAHNIEIMIEDSSRNLKEISKEIPVICYDSEYNKDACGTNITRCHSWYEIYMKISEKFQN